MRIVNTHLKKRGQIQLAKRIPADVRSLHGNAVFIRQSLKTSDVKAARRLRDKVLRELEADWTAYRLRPKGTLLSRDEMHQALMLKRELTSGGKDVDDVKDVIEDVTLDIYRTEIPEELDGELSSEKAGEFFRIASGTRTPTSLAADQFLQRANLKPSTVRLYRICLAHLAKQFPCIEQIDRKSVSKFLSDFSSTRTAKSTNNLIAASSSLLSFHSLNPSLFRGHRIDAGVPAVAKGVWTNNEAYQLINANSAPQWLRDCINIALHSGLRRQEIAGLVYDNERNQLVVEKSKAKTAHSVRRVPCHPLIRGAVARILASPPKEKAISVGIARLAKKLDIKTTITIDGVPQKRDFHAIRHTFASKLTAQGIPEETIGRILGHASKSITARYAGKVDPELTRNAIEAVNYGSHDA
jgi:integrase